LPIGVGTMYKVDIGETHQGESFKGRVQTVHY
jgi:hypothetical protein